MTLRVGAHVVAAPVLELASEGRPRRGTVLARGSTAAFVETDGFVVTLAARGAPLMPNGVALAGVGASIAALRPGSPAAFSEGGIRTESLDVVWDPADPPVWRPEERSPLALGSCTATRAAEVLRALGVEPNADPLRLAHEVVGVDPAWADAGAGVGALFEGVTTGRPSLARRAALALVGLGAGATPSGDDLLGGVAGAVESAARGRGASPPAWLASLRLPDLRRRTTALSATLLELALTGRLMEPAGTLVDALAGTAPASLGRALARVRRVGHSTGDRYAVGIASTAYLLATH